MCNYYMSSEPLVIVTYLYYVLSNGVSFGGAAGYAGRSSPPQVLVPYAEAFYGARSYNHVRLHLPPSPGHAQQCNRRGQSPALLRAGVQPNFRIYCLLEVLQLSLLDYISGVSGARGQMATSFRIRTHVVFCQQATKLRTKLNGYSGCPVVEKRRYL
jgi:hypothetical protein